MRSTANKSVDLSRAFPTSAFSMENEFAGVRAVRRADAAPSLTKRLVNHARPNDVTQGYAADWATTHLREPAQKIADRIEALLHRREAL